MIKNQQLIQFIEIMLNKKYVSGHLMEINFL